MCTMPIITVQVNEQSRYEIIARAVPCGCDWNVSVTGGSCHHIGAVTVYSPDSPESPALHFSFPEHKDEFVSQLFAKELVRIFHSKIVVSAGIHIDNATKDEIRFLLKSSEECCQRLIQAMRKHQNPPL